MEKSKEEDENETQEECEVNQIKSKMSRKKCSREGRKRRRRGRRIMVEENEKMTKKKMRTSWPVCKI